MEGSKLAILRDVITCDRSYAVLMELVPIRCATTSPCLRKRSILLCLCDSNQDPASRGTRGFFRGYMLQPDTTVVSARCVSEVDAGNICCQLGYARNVDWLRCRSRGQVKWLKCAWLCYIGKFCTKLCQLSLRLGTKNKSMFRSHLVSCGGFFQA